MECPPTNTIFTINKSFQNTSKGHPHKKTKKIFGFRLRMNLIYFMGCGGGCRVHFHLNCSIFVG